MRLLKYSFKDGPKGGWEFSQAQLKKVNLLVGPTGSGKSRFTNTLFNVALFINAGEPFRSGVWDITFKAGERTYHWSYAAVPKTPTEDAHIARETLTVLEPDGEKTLIERDRTKFIFRQQELPKLSKTSPAIFLLREEDDIAPIHNEFSRILRRSFWGPDLLEACKMANIPGPLLELAKKKNKDGDAMRAFLQNVPLGPRLYVLRELDRKKYDALIEQYRTIFPSVESLDFTEGAELIDAPAQGKVPVVAIKERSVAHPVLLHDLSSGMQKVLLILTDVMTMADGTVYIIDEYENSLGVNAINFLPGFIDEYGASSQFIITSHHPYLINSTPMKNWLVFRRRGSLVQIESGEDLSRRYGSSKQDAFVQLLNDPEFAGGNI